MTSALNPLSLSDYLLTASWKYCICLNTSRFCLRRWFCVWPCVTFLSESQSEHQNVLFHYICSRWLCRLAFGFEPRLQIKQKHHHVSYKTSIKNSYLSLFLDGMKNITPASISWAGNKLWIMWMNVFWLSWSSSSLSSTFPTLWLALRQSIAQMGYLDCGCRCMKTMLPAW